MKIGLVGYGRMGHQIEQIVQTSHHMEISAIFESDHPLTPSSDVLHCDVLIDFSSPQAVPNTLQAAAILGLPVVEGTTGWYERLSDFTTLPGLTMLYSPNFSIGVYLFSQLIESAARTFGAIEAYDVYIHEWHHRGKADSPSGTARHLADLVLNNMPAKKHVLTSPANGKIANNTLHVTSTRVGRVPGTHEVGFDSEFDTVLLRHRAHGREGFAFGAIKAAQWIKNKKGIYTMDDFMDGLFSKSKNAF